MNYPIYHIITSNYTTYMLSCYASVWNQELDPCTSAVVQRSNDNDTSIYMISQYIITWGLGHGNITTYLQPPKMHQNLAVAEWL